MPDASHESSQQRDGHAARHPSEHEHQASDLAADTQPAYPVSLLGSADFSGRGNAPVQAEVIQRMQQTYGNRAVQRFLQRTRSSPAAHRRTVQRQEAYGPPSAQVPAQTPSYSATPAETPATPTPPTETPAPPKDDGRVLSGSSWVSQFPTSTSVSDLESDFAGKVQKFIDAMKAGGASIDIDATKRPENRAFLMHWSWRIVKEDYDPQKIEAREGVNINWWHGDAAKSKAAAQEMVTGYAIDGLGVAPSLTSRHIAGKAIDMGISWSGELKIKKADGTEQTITTEPRNATNPDLIAVGATYGVIHFTEVAKDKNHWSTDGK